MSNGDAPVALVVDDDLPVRGFLATTLELEGWTVRQVKDGRAAIKALLDDPPDLVVLDMMMPRASGLEVLQAMSAHPHLMKVPAVVCTARESLLEQQAAATLGAAEWLVKPIDSSELVSAVQRATGRS